MPKTERLIKQYQAAKVLGKVCYNCGATEDIEYHHIVPLSLGGQDIITNLAPLCSDCHRAIHFGTNPNRVNHSEATKRGIKKARAEGKQIGCQKGTKLTTKKSIIAKEKIMSMSKDFDGNMSDVDLLPAIGISRNTFYKYKKELKEEYDRRMSERIGLDKN